MIISQAAHLTMTNSLFGEKTFSAHMNTAAELKLEKVIETWTENKTYERTPSAGYEGISEAEITVNVE